MCGARSATGLGLAAALGNPAAVAALDGGQAAFSHLQWAGGLSKQWAGAGLPLRQGAAITLDAAVLHGPELQGYDIDGVATVPFQAMEWNAGLHTALPLGKGLAVGLGARLLRLEDPTDPLTAVGFSLGLQSRGVTRTAGIALIDAGGPMQGAQGSYVLPTRWRAGVEQEVAQGRLLIAASVDGGIKSAVRGAIGIVVRPVALMELMGGLQTGSDGEGGSPVGWATGATVKLVGVAVSSAFRQERTLGATYLIGIRLERR